MSESNETKMNTERKEKTGQPVPRVATLALLLSLIAIISSILVYFHGQQQAHQQTRQINNNIKTQFTDLQTDINLLENQQATQKSAALKTKKTLLELQNTISSGTLQWQLSQLNYLLRLANYQLLYLHNLPTAITLLQAAKKEVIQSNRPQWLLLANALQADLDTLQALPDTSTSNMLSQLTGINSQINDLPLITTPVHTNHIETDDLVESKQTHLSMKQWAWWKLRLETLWDELSHILIIRHHDPVIKPLVDPIQKRYLRENLHLLVFQMKWAVLHHENKTYQAGLNQFSQWLHQYFDIDANQTRAILNEIQGLQKITLIATLPSIDRSLNAFDHIRQSVETRPIFKRKLTPTKSPSDYHPGLSKPKPTPDLPSTKIDTVEVTES